MIKLYVEDYCANCPEFEPEVDKEDYGIVYAEIGFHHPNPSQSQMHETTITCSHATRCSNMYDILRSHKNNE